MEEDDDFGDFGGFEAADPNENPTGDRVEAGVSPWAVFPQAVPQSQPDLLCAQNTFPTYLDPAGIVSGNNNSNNQHHLDLHTEDFERLPNNHNGITDQARIAENVLDGTLGARVPGLDLTPGHPALRGAGNPADIFLNTDSRVLPDLGVGEKASLPDLGVGEGPSLLGDLDRNLELSAPTVDNSQRHVNSVLTNNIDSVVDSVPVNNVRASSAGSEDILLLPEDRQQEEAAESNTEELLSLQTLNTKLEEDLTKTQAELEKQNRKLSEIESRHHTELNDIRQAGHDALAVVVEQYKETTRTAVLEQQELSTRYIQDKIKEMTQIFNSSLDELNIEFKNKQQAERETQQREITEAVDKSRREQQERFDTFLAEEREKNREEIQKALQTERESSQQKLESAIQACHVSAAEGLVKEEEKFNKRLKEEEKESRENIKTVLSEEQAKLQESMKQSLKEEQERNRVAMETVVQQARQDSQDLVTEQRQLDSRVRRRHLASLDIFLESARQQIQLLQESENPHSSASASASGGDTEKDQKS